MAGAAAASSKKKKKVGEDGEGSTNPEAAERKRLRSLAFSNNILSQTHAKTLSPLSPSKMVAKHHGKDIVKRSQRKNKFLFSFPGLLAPVAGGKIGELKDLGTKNPVLYLDFPQIVFSDAWWIGSAAENPEEARLDFPKELSDGQHAEYDFKGGAGGGTCINKQISHKTGITDVEEQSPRSTPEDDLSEDENKDLKATPVRHSARTAGKTFKFAEAFSGDDSTASDPDEYEEDKNILALDSSSRNHTTGNILITFFDIDSDDAIEGTQSPIQNRQSASSETESKKQSSISIKKNKSREDSSSNHGSLVQTTISTLFKKVEEKDNDESDEEWAA
ncbi:hypothetical protein L484_002488 [Morus notabilis]|uniref:DNA-binding protein RHL1 n=1 Tax=Morus notabilis TaxID=981085 RepID=W9S1A4_9ROSA|nr:hypothetical protein L484_002488 [Morus notabilis]